MAYVRAADGRWYLCDDAWVTAGGWDTCALCRISIYLLLAQTCLYLLLVWWCDVYLLLLLLVDAWWWWWWCGGAARMALRGCWCASAGGGGVAVLLAGCRRLPPAARACACTPTPGGRQQRPVELGAPVGAHVEMGPREAPAPPSPAKLRRGRLPPPRSITHSITRVTCTP